MVLLSNLIDLLVALLFVIVALVMLLHKVLWPLLEKPLYALQRTGIVGRRKLLVTIGFMFLSSASGLSFEHLKKILEQLSG